MPKPEVCAICGAAMLSVLYYGADDQPLGGHHVCTSCGPRSVVEVERPEADVRRSLLERKAS